VTLKYSVAVVCQLAVLKGSAGVQFHLFGLTAVSTFHLVRLTFSGT
jgi:hypothetical protein